MDRLLANPHLEQERVKATRALAHEWLSDLPQLLIVVDFSPVTDEMAWHLLRASVVVDGRSITLFEEVHPRKHLTAFKVHQTFVKQLAALVPPCQRTPSSSPMQAFAPPGSGSWPNKAGAGLVAPAIATLSGGNEKRHTQATKSAECNREPWLLSVSPSLAYLGAVAIVNIYSQRMRIKQQFRDTKNAAHGMGLACAKSRGQRRLQALLLIAHIAAMAKRLICEAPLAQQLELQLTSNNIKNRKTISLMTLAMRVIERPDLLKKIADAWPYIYALRQQAAVATGGAGVRV